MRLRRLYSGRKTSRPLAIAFVALLSGCQSINGQQRPITSADLHSNVCPSQSDLDKFNGLRGVARRDFRDDTILDCVKAIDKRYIIFTTALHQETASTNLATDVVALGLTAGSTLSGGSTAKALSQGGVFAIGVGTAVNKDVFYHQTLPAIQAIMDANRDKVLVNIIDAEKHDQTGDVYTLANAGFDIDAYQNAGNIYNAIAELSKTASVAAEKAKAAVSKSQQGKYRVYKLSVDVYSSEKKLTDYVWALKSANVADVAKLNAIVEKLSLTPDPSEKFEDIQADIVNAIDERVHTGDPAAQIVSLQSDLAPLMK